MARYAFVCPYCGDPSDITEEHVRVTRIGPMTFDMSGVALYDHAGLEITESKTLRCGRCLQTFDSPEPVELAPPRVNKPRKSR